jgi:hypothetical protein
MSYCYFLELQQASFDVEQWSSWDQRRHRSKILSRGPRIENNPPTKSSEYLNVNANFGYLLKIYSFPKSNLSHQHDISQKYPKYLGISMCIYSQLSMTRLTYHGTALSVYSRHSAVIRAVLATLTLAALSFSHFPIVNALS